MSNNNAAARVLVAEKAGARAHDSILRGKALAMHSDCTSNKGRKEIAMKIDRWKLNLVTLILIVSAHSRATCQQNDARGNEEEDPPHTHNMLVVGKESAFLSHLPMFEALNGEKPDYTSPHRYQVILEARFIREGKDLTDIYTKDREISVGTKMYTIKPVPKFVLPRLFTPSTRSPALSSFRATVFRGHLERGGNKIDGLKDVVVDVKRVVHARKFEPSEDKPEKLQYFLFGRGDELFLAHLITKPPDFDQILSVKISDPQFTDEELNRGVSVIFQDRNNTAAQRIKENERAQAQSHVTGAHQFLDLQVQAGTEYYFEEGELAIPPLFEEQTAEEKKAGF